MLEMQMWLHDLILDSSRAISGEQTDLKYQNLCRKGEKRRQVKMKKCEQGCGIFSQDDDSRKDRGELVEE